MCLWICNIHFSQTFSLPAQKGWLERYLIPPPRTYLQFGLRCAMQSTYIKSDSNNTRTKKKIEKIKENRRYPYPMTPNIAFFSPLTLNFIIRGEIKKKYIYILFNMIVVLLNRNHVFYCRHFADLYIVLPVQHTIGSSERLLNWGGGGRYFADLPCVISLSNTGCIFRARSCPLRPPLSLLSTPPHFLFSKFILCLTSAWPVCILYMQKAMVHG